MSTLDRWYAGVIADSRPPNISERDWQIVQRAISGTPLADLATDFRISQKRVSQILFQAACRLRATQDLPPVAYSLTGAHSIPGLLPGRRPRKSDQLFIEEQQRRHLVFDPSAPTSTSE
jgi:hypothetical protein